MFAGFFCLVGVADGVFWVADGVFAVADALSWVADGVFAIRNAVIWFQDGVSWVDFALAWIAAPVRLRRGSLCRCRSRSGFCP